MLIAISLSSAINSNKYYLNIVRDMMKYIFESQELLTFKISYSYLMLLLKKIKFTQKAKSCISYIPQRRCIFEHQDDLEKHRE